LLRAKYKNTTAPIKKSARNEAALGIKWLQERPGEEGLNKVFAVIICNLNRWLID